MTRLRDEHVVQGINFTVALWEAFALLADYLLYGTYRHRGSTLGQNKKHLNKCVDQSYRKCIVKISIAYV